MPLVVDPAGSEIGALRKAARWRGRQILEIGCGDGRLTLRLAALQPGRIEAMDPDGARVRQARKGLPEQYHKLIRYHVGQAERLRHAKDQFDIVIFSWAL